MAKIAFLGLGVMGFPMAGHLQAKGHSVTVYNRTTEKARNWVAEHGGVMAQTPKEAAEGADFVMACVGNDDDLRGVTLGQDGAFAGMRLLKCSCFSPKIMRTRIADHRQRAPCSASSPSTTEPR